MRKKTILLGVACILVTIIIYVCMPQGRKYVTDIQYPMQLTHLLPEGFKNTDFNEYLGMGGGYLFQKAEALDKQFNKNMRKE